MPETPDLAHLDTLRTLSVRQLQARWAELRVRGDPPHFKHALVRGIAWHIQERHYGGLDPETRRLLKAAIRNAPGPRARQGTPSAPTTTRKRRRKADLEPGTTLVRTWRGRDHEVAVLGPRRFRYRDTEYASLSEIAREITGARWSGPRFFGLKKARAAS